MKRTKLIILTLLLSVGCYTAFSQRTVTLEEAMDIAFTNSPDIQRSKINIKTKQRVAKCSVGFFKIKICFRCHPIFL